ncbi:MAG: FecR domain-containing protein [Tannerella sp.]|jgi:ferric-dicitrate binding protein FerR (iron transport regulator)|nr:FecR domain-containing protein [Tannerella sp.]
MDKKDIRSIITCFFENNFPKELILKFQFWFSKQENKDLKDEILNELWEKETAEANELTIYGLEEMGRRIEKRSACLSLPQRILRIAGIFLLPVAGSLLTYWLMNNPDDKSVTAHNTQMVEYIVPDGEMQQVTLPDGSEIWLNAGSMLLYSGDFSGPTRTLFLNGEATFNVIKDPERPFIVKTQYMQVQALGTTFNVKSYNNTSLTEVTLEEGLVRVDVNGKVTVSEVIYPDEQFVYDHRYATTSKYRIDAELVAKWREGYLVFQDATFEDIIHTIERRFKVIVNYDIRRYGGGTFSIKYMPYENVEQVLTILETLNPGLKWTKENDIITIK